MHAGGQEFDPPRLHHFFGGVAQLARAIGSYPVGRGFKSLRRYHLITEVYPSPAEGIGLENRQGMKVPRGFESLNLRHLNIAGWSSLVARRAHNPKVVGSNPSPATKWSGSSVG